MKFGPTPGALERVCLKKSTHQRGLERKVVRGEVEEAHLDAGVGLAQRRDEEEHAEDQFAAELRNRFENSVSRRRRHE